MPKKRAKLKEKEDDVSSCSQSKISKYFCAKSSQKLQTALSNVEVSREEKDEIPPEGQIQDLESVNLSEEYLRILPETLKKLENFAYRNNTPTDEDDVCLSDDFCHEMGTSIANAVVVTKADDFPPDSHGENLYADKSYEDQQRVDITDPNNTNPIGKSGKQKYTPLELQYLDFKKEYPDAILFIECGYKYRIFGEDAQVASKELGFGCFMNHNFPTSSFPVQRLAVHVRRLVSKGYKVGVVNQTETAATKAAGDTKNTLFSRKLHALYTQSTLIGEGFDDDTAVDDLIAYQAPMVSGYLMTVCDEELNGQRKHAASIGVMVVNVSTGNVMYASFEDDAPRSKLEDIFAQVNPVELLLPETKLTSKTENLITNVCDASSLTRGNIRVERKDDDIFDFSIALPAVSKFFSVKKNDTTEIDGIRESDRLKEVLSLPPLVLCCLSALISYLKEFDLGSILQEWR